MVDACCKQAPAVFSRSEPHLMVSPHRQRYVATTQYIIHRFLRKGEVMAPAAMRMINQPAVSLNRSAMHRVNGLAGAVTVVLGPDCEHLSIRYDWVYPARVTEPCAWGCGSWRKPQQS